MPVARRVALTEAFFRIHPWIYRKTGGRIPGRFGKTPILLLTTRGRKSGQPRTHGLLYLDRGDRWAVAASWAGEPEHPLWYLNLMAQPDATIQVGSRRIPVRARALEGAERALVWKEIVAQDASFAEYEKRTRQIREIPVVMLEPRDTDANETRDGAHVLYGLSCSYFTGKLESYFQTKGVPFRFVEMSKSQFQACARATGIVQLPCVETPDGTWLTDTNAIMEHFEAGGHGPRVRPEDPATAFCSLLLEDLFDEWFWRPALYYRWAFDEDARLMSNQLARTMFRDVSLPLFLRRQFVLHRQRIVYLKKDGVTKQTAPAIEALYMDALRELDAIFTHRPFLFGDRPCEADFGLFGPFFRHFFCDPTPGALMRKHAPQVAHWVTRLWKTRPADLDGTAALSRVPDDLGFFLEMAANDYLPYLEANSLAVASGAEEVRYRAQGVDWQIPSAPYRAECFNELKRRFAALDRDAGREVASVLPKGGVALLEGPVTVVTSGTDRLGRRGRLGRAAALFD
jgi:deazaflavin-dependent oxidoreductase (nitroreductase family)